MRECLTDPTKEESTIEAVAAPLKSARSVARNAWSNIIRLAATTIVAILLPGFLTQRLPVAVYAAWVLILQASNYIAYLDFGVQTAISKYIAEFEEKNDRQAASDYASSGMAITVGAAALGMAAMLIVAFFVPDLVDQLPRELIWQVRLSVIIVGFSVAVRLATSSYLSVFLGLRQYQVPMYVSVAGRVLFAGFVLGAVGLRQPLLVVAGCGASANFLSAALQYISWRSAAKFIVIAWKNVKSATSRHVVTYCSITALWSVCALAISGLDVIVVGHYSFREAGYYSIATAPVTLLLTIISALVGPLLPEASALSATRTPQEMGKILVKVTTLITSLLLLCGLPLLIAGHLILSLWVGHTYADHSLSFLRILLIANLIRNICAPYAAMVLATGRQKAATISPLAEGISNLTLSIVLARTMGAKGVAIGTLIGAIIGVAVHLIFSMRATKDVLCVTPWRFLSGGVFRPALMVLPWMLIVPLWWAPQRLQHSLIPVLLASICSVALCYIAIPADDRCKITAHLRAKISR